MGNSKIVKKKIAKEILKRLRRKYKKSRGDFVNWKNPLELLIATILSAQCTDKKVNEVTRSLFKKYKKAEDYANADIKELEQEIYSTGFYRNKAKNIKSLAKILVERYKGKVPDNLDDLLSLPGVSYKTAYLVLSKAYGKNVGVAIDTHLKRILPRLGLVDETKNTDKMSKEMAEILDKKDYLDINEYLILHGRKVCGRVPQCSTCILKDICRYGRSLPNN